MLSTFHAKQSLNSAATPLAAFSNLAETKRESIKQDSIGIPKLSNVIKESKSDLMIGKSVKNGDCFFDSIAQAVKGIPMMPEQTIKSLRQIMKVMMMKIFVHSC